MRLTTEQNNTVWHEDRRFVKWYALTGAAKSKYAIKAKMSGRVYLVGIGPGSQDNMTPKAVNTLKNVQVVIGHEACLGLVRKFITGREIVISEMTPVERAEIAVEKAREGKDVALVSTGDTGIYAIASTFFSYLKDKGLRVEVEVIPGVTVASAAAAILGSPLGHDFAVISLADLATKLSAIKRRLESAAKSDFVVVLYNPKGKVGDKRVKEALETLMTYRKAATPVGIVTNATTESEKVKITTLAEVSGYDIDTDTIVIVGNSETFVFNGKMVTPRGYKKGVGY
jgi:precorrin-3B C17-methyltransferase